MDDLLKDPRFAHVARDPKFKPIPKAERKVKIDKRFHGMFNDKKFGLKYTVDKRGRPVRQTPIENLKKYYDLSSSEDEDTSVNDKSSKSKKKKSQKEKQKDTEVVEKAESSEIEQNDREGKDDSSYDDDDDSDKDKSDDEVNDGIDSDDDNDSTCMFSNGELLRVKPKEECDNDSESDNVSGGSDEDDILDKQNAKDDEEENEKQLKIKKKSEERSALTDAVKEKLMNLDIDYARGEGILMTDSSSDEESSEYSDDEGEIEHDWGQLDKEAETTEEATHRLALCNMDWDRIRATDLMVLFNSFLPSGGLIHSVTIYPSEYGLQRMQEEEVKGPSELVETTNDKEDEEDEEGSCYHMEKLRQYQLNRLKYYYAVVDCDSAETANKIYTECDGMEYESTATKLDLRFIPDDMEFDQEPREACDKLPELTKYQPRLFTTTALQQVKVDLTWDETNPDRQEVTQKLCSGKLDEIDETDIQAYLASGTSDEESDADDKKRKDQEINSNSDGDSNVDPIEKYKSLLRDIEEQEEAKKAKEVELEFTWGLGEKEKTEKLVKERMKKDEDLTPFEQYLEKRKAKRKMRKEEKKKLKSAEDEASESEDSIPDGVDMNDPYFKEELQSVAKPKKKGHGKHHRERTPDSGDERCKAELELLLMDKDDADDKRHFNMKQIEEQSSLSKSKRKRLSKKKNGQAELKEDTFTVDVKDPRFNALYTSHHYNIDPADPHYRKTKGTEALVTEKLKRRTTDNDIEAPPKQPKTDKKLSMELQALIKSVKKNTRNMSQPIK